MSDSSSFIGKIRKVQSDFILQYKFRHTIKYWLRVIHYSHKNIISYCVRVCVNSLVVYTRWAGNNLEQLSCAKNAVHYLQYQIVSIYKNIKIFECTHPVYILGTNGALILAATRGTRNKLQNKFYLLESYHFGLCLLLGELQSKYKCSSYERSS